MKFKAWITKYALTKGIFMIEAELCKPATMIRDVNHKHRCYHNKDWHLTYNEAIIHASTMAKRKIESLEKKKQILENFLNKWEECLRE